MTFEDENHGERDLRLKVNGWMSVLMSVVTPNWNQSIVD